MCGHGPKNSRSRLSIFYFHRTNSPNPWRPDLKENEAVGAAIWQNHLSHFFGFIAIFAFHRVFSNQDGPSRLFPALGFRRYVIFQDVPFHTNHFRGCSKIMVPEKCLYATFSRTFRAPAESGQGIMIMFSCAYFVKQSYTGGLY